MSEHSESVQRLASTAFDDDGWMSDAQDTRLEWDEVNQSLHFCGEGSVDVGHMVSLVLADQGKPQITAPCARCGVKLVVTDDTLNSNLDVCGDCGVQIGRDEIKPQITDDLREDIAVVKSWLGDDEELRLPDTRWGVRLYASLRSVLAALGGEA